MKDGPKYLGYRVGHLPYSKFPQLALVSKRNPVTNLRKYKLSVAEGVKGA